MSSTCCLKCNQPYRDPRMLSCCHSFCTQCIQSLINEGTGTNTFTCPSCHHIVSVSKGGVSSFPRNLRLVNKQSNIFSKIKSIPPPPCESCSENISVAYCTECNDLLCKQCWDAHQLLRLTRTHTSFTLEEAQHLSHDKLAVNTCQDHTNQQVKYYCEECTVPVCVECTIINHNGHVVTEAIKHAEQCKEDIEQRFKSFQLAEQQLKQLLITGEKIKDNIKASKYEIDTIIRQTFANLQQLLCQKEKVLLAKSCELANAKEDRLSLQLQGIHRLLESMTYCHSLSTSAVGEYNDVELLSIAHTLQTRANHLQKQYAETSLEVCESPTISVDINTDELATKIGNVDITFNEISPNNTTVVMPFGFAVDKELKIKVLSKDKGGKLLSKGGAIVSGSLVPVEEKGTPIKAKTTDCGDGTYLVSLTPQQLGQHKLFLTIIGLSVHGSPFNVSVVASRDYNTIRNPVQTITGISKPDFLAFSDNGDMFVTSFYNHCIYIYDNNGRKKKTIGSFGTGSLHFKNPVGIAISGDVMYVAEYGGNRIHKLTLEGRFFGTLGSEGSGKGQFLNPFALCIGPDERIYIADGSNNRIQVFCQDKTFSHIIDGNESGFKYPNGLSFDPSGHLHITCYDSKVVIVVTPNGQFVCQYGNSHLIKPHGIAIDLAGNSLVANRRGDSIVIFDPHGTFIRSIEGFNRPIGVTVASDGSVWVSDQDNNRLVKY